jgi:hypothetical protein
MIERRVLPDRSNDEVVAALLEELAAGFAASRWAIIVTTGGLHRLHVGAAVRHTAYLMREIQAAVNRGDELVARILGRAQFEAFLIGLYLHHGGPDALEALAAGYHQALRSWAADIDQYNAKVTAARKAARKSNKRIRKANLNRDRHNTDHPEREPLPLLSLVPEPPLDLMDFNLEVPIGRADVVEAEGLPLREVVERLNRLFAEMGDPGGAVEVSYNYVFRALSTLGAHTTISVLDSYITGQDRNFIRVGNQMNAPPMGPGIAATAIVLTAFLGLTAMEPEADSGLLPSIVEVCAAARAGLPEK